MFPLRRQRALVASYNKGHTIGTRVGFWLYLKCGSFRGHTTFSRTPGVVGTAPYSNGGSIHEECLSSLIPSRRRLSALDSSQVCSMVRLHGVFVVPCHPPQGVQPCPTKPHHSIPHWESLSCRCSILRKLSHSCHHHSTTPSFSHLWFSWSLVVYQSYHVTSYEGTNPCLLIPDWAPTD